MILSEIALARECVNDIADILEKKGIILSEDLKHEMATVLVGKFYFYID